MVIVWEEVSAAETLRVSGPTSGTSNVLLIQMRAASLRDYSFLMFVIDISQGFIDRFSRCVQILFSVSVANISMMVGV